MKMHVPTISMRATFASCLVGWGLLGCQYNPLLPDLRTAADRAHEVQSRCARRSEAEDTHVLSADIIESVQGAYNYVASGNDRAARLVGARIQIHPESTFSAQTLQLSLECHQARVVTRAVAERPDDPYSLPGTWLNIKAESTGDGFAVLVLVDRDEPARKVLARAQRFAARRSLIPGEDSTALRASGSALDAATPPGQTPP
jgi:hypothetical protein